MADEFRLEKDSLGELAVPEDALYGIQTQRASRNFPITGKKPWRAFIWSMALIKYCAAQVNRDLGLLDDPRASAIQSAAMEVMEGKWDDQFIVDPIQAGAGTSHNMNVNEVIANRATQLMGGGLGEYWVHPNDHVNMSQSTNDTIPTAIRLGCLWRLGELEGVIDNLITAFYDKGEQFDDVLKSGRTHLQDALPVRLGQEFAAYGKALERDRERLHRSSQGLKRLGIGGTAVGSGLNAPPQYRFKMVEYLKTYSGWDLIPADNLFEAMQSMADFADFSAAMRIMALTLTRIANDIRLLASGPATGLDEIRLPAVQPGSSIMPGKVNPVMAEMLNMAMFTIQGLDQTVALAAQAGQLELNVMMPIIGHCLFEEMQIMIASIQAFTEKCVKGIQANRSKAMEWLEKNAIIITALNPLIGYNAGASIVKEAINANRSVREIVMEKAEKGELIHRAEQRPLHVSEVMHALDNLYQMTQGGILGEEKAD
ncbi:MAG: aspartate ammonia-lyase [Anaerolineales bacterium]